MQLEKVDQKPETSAPRSAIEHEHTLLRGTLDSERVCRQVATVDLHLIFHSDSLKLSGRWSCGSNRNWNIRDTKQLACAMLY